MERQIIALGGGGFSAEDDNPVLDKYILRRTNKSNPKICFIGTASADSESYILKFYTCFLRLRCEPSHLSLFRLPTKDLESFILDQDAIYVGGGNTRSMLALWREWNLNKYLRTAWENGVVLSGISAGAICWFEEGLSDFFPGELNRLDCLGFLRGSHCPHYDSEENRRPDYQRLILSGEMLPGVAAEDDVALHYVGTELANVVSPRRGAKAYSVRSESGEIVEETMPATYLEE